MKEVLFSLEIYLFCKKQHIKGKGFESREWFISTGGSECADFLGDSKEHYCSQCKLARSEEVDLI